MSDADLMYGDIAHKPAAMLTFDFFDSLSDVLTEVIEVVIPDAVLPEAP